MKDDKVKVGLGVGAIGLAVVGALIASGNATLDCGHDRGYCVAMLRPPAAECTALFANGSGGPNETFRDLDHLASEEIIHSWVALPLPNGECFVEVRLKMDLDGKKPSGQAARWKTVAAQVGLGRHRVNARLDGRPSFALRDGCRSHVWDEEPCAESVDIDDL